MNHEYYHQINLSKVQSDRSLGSPAFNARPHCLLNKIQTSENDSQVPQGLDLYFQPYSPLVTNSYTLVHGSLSVVTIQVSSASPGNFLEIHILCLHRCTETETGARMQGPVY